MPPQRLVNWGVLLQVPNWKFIGINQSSTCLATTAVKDHLSAPAILVKMLEIIKQSLEMVIIGILLLFWNSHIDDNFPQGIDWLLWTLPYSWQQGIPINWILEWFGKCIFLQPLGNNPYIIVKISPHQLSLLIINTALFLWFFIDYWQK